MTITCITFDLDDTLWECPGVIARAEHALYEWLDQHMPRITAAHDDESLVEHRRTFAGRHPHLTYDITTLRRRWLAEVAEEFGYQRAASEHGFRLFWERRNAVEIYPGVVDLLERLSRRFTLGTITNGNADVHYIGIGHLFDFVLSAADAGASKPDRRIFRAAGNRSGQPLETTLHVGDDPVRDIVGASTVGMRTAWINPRLAPWPGGQTPDLVLRHVTELEAAIDRLTA